ncbi:MAG: TrmJ/YjtD family RNA methyltransferase [Candidatus Obscuribacterales bacterium]|nr:TrmJ/YjtD family RNA methyltransferase [Candidatus Obscuribacterales bacterium]
MHREDIVFILVRPSFLGNIGSAARVLKNFGFSNLRLVAPPKNYKDAESRKMAVDAFDILKNSRVFTDLNEALEDINLVLGTSCAKQRLCSFLELPELDAYIGLPSKNLIAILFGNERDGLTRDELLQCHQIIKIPVSETFPSINLAQAVGIVAYELSRRSSSSLELPEMSSRAEENALFEKLEIMLEQIGFTRSFNKTSVRSELRSLLLRSRPSRRELGILRGILAKFQSRLSESDGHQQS